MKDNHITEAVTGAGLFELEHQKAQTRRSLNGKTSDSALDMPATSNAAEQQLHPKQANTEQTLDLEMLPPSLSPVTVAHVVERWNEPRFNMFRTFATFWSFVIMGANDAAYGVSAC